MEKLESVREDVKEYTPRKKKLSAIADNYTILPAIKITDEKGNADAADNIDNNMMMSTAEIIDFGAGTDSWTNQH